MDDFDHSKDKGNRRQHWIDRKYGLGAGKVSGGCRSEVRSEQKLCWPHKNQVRGSRALSLAPFSTHHILNFI